MINNTYHDSLILKRNTDSYGNPISINIVDIKPVMDNHSCIVLSQLPDENFGVTIDGFIEVYGADHIGALNFKVDYPNGVIYFNPISIGKSITIEYKGIGCELIYCSRIASRLDAAGNVVETLEEMIERGKNYLSLIDSLGNAATVISKIELKTKEATTLYDLLHNDIAVAKPIQEGLHNDVAEAKKFKDKLAEDVAEGKPLALDLGRKITEGNALDIRLEKNIQTAANNVALIEAAGNKSYIIESDEFSLEGGFYTKILNHNMNSSNLQVAVLEDNNGIFSSSAAIYDSIDINNIKIKVDERKRVKVIITASYYSGGADIAEEVIDARGNKFTLGERLNNIDGYLNNIAINVLSCEGGSFTDKFKAAIEIARKNKADIFIPSGEFDLLGLSYSINFSTKIYGTDNTILYVDGANMFSIQDGCKRFSIDNLTIINANTVVDGSELTGVIDSININNIRCKQCHTLVEWRDNIVTSGVDTMKISNCNWSEGRFHAVRFSANKFNTVEITGNKVVDSCGSGFIIGNDTITEFIDRKNVICRNNIFKNLSRVGVGSSKPVQCFSLFADDVIVDGNKFEELDNDDKNECEAVYTKSTQTSITNNIFIDAGRKDGFLCIKGRGEINPAGSHNSYNHIVSGNKFISTREDSLQRAFYTNAENIIVSNNIFKGNYETINYIIDANRVNINNNIYDDVVCASVFTCSSSAEYADNPTDIQISNNIINNVSNNSNSYYIFSIRTNANGDKYRIFGNKITNVDNSSTSSRVLNIVAGSLYDLFEYRDNHCFGVTFNYATLSSLKTNVLILKNNIGYITANYGIATIPAGSKTLNINHLLSYSPTGYDTTYYVKLTPITQLTGQCYITGVTGSKFTLNLEAVQEAEVQIMWEMGLNELNKKTI